MPVIDQVVLRRVKRRDRAARWVITLGGVAIIATVILILALIVSVSFPLFRGARGRLRADLPLPRAGAEVACLGVDLVELGEQAGADSLTVYVAARDGTFTFFDLAAAAAGETPALAVLAQHKAVPPGGDQGQTIAQVERSGGARYTLLWSDGRVSQVEAVVAAHFDEAGRRSVRCSLKEHAAFPPEDGPQPLQALVRCAVGEEGTAKVAQATCVKLLPGNRLAVVRQTTRENELTGDTETTSHRTVIAEGLPGPIAALTMDSEGKRLFAGTADGGLARWELKDDGAVGFHENVVAFRDRRAITALGMVFGDATLAVGDATGAVTAWFEVREEEARHLRLIRPLSRHGQAVAELLPSRRNGDKSLMSLGGEGVARLAYMTSGANLLDLAADSPLQTIGYSPRANALAGLGADGRLRVWQISSPHSDVSWNVLFGKVHYEGYAEPEYKWQSEGEEPKYSLVPIIFGTLKSTLYAMLFAVPMALFGAVYVSYFTTPAFKQAIKPIIEIMAAVPSVVVGFLILLWAGPKMAEWLVAVFASAVTIPLAFVAFMGLWQIVRKYDALKWIEHGYEFLALIPVICLGVLLAAWAAPWIENGLFDGNFRQWLFNATGEPYAPLNALVVAFGLGFAVIPIIFSISEDALSNIPHSLTAASLALGASRWQTLWRVVLPSASPGIFAAIMIGFGRAVGETMIVFMATGNTPLLSWNPLNGFRTLAANIAMETPEAPVGGSLYRILFLCAVILFAMTFALNTTAEVVRQRLRNKYGRY